MGVGFQGLEKVHDVIRIAAQWDRLARDWGHLGVGQLRSFVTTR
jgi:hypothetical protein